MSTKKVETRFRTGKKFSFAKSVLKSEREKRSARAIAMLALSLGLNLQAAMASDVATPSNYDLSSTAADLTAHNSSAVSVQLGGTVDGTGYVSNGTQTVIQPGQQVSAAMAIAIQQVLNGGQTLVINSAGQAVGGSAFLNASTGLGLTNLNVPTGVSLISIGYHADNPLNVSGTVNISGNLFTLQNQAGLTSLFNLGSLNVGNGGLFSTIAPTSLSMFTNNLFSSQNLSLNITNNLFNAGTIAAPTGALNITAGGSIINQSAANSVASMVAQNINLSSAIGQITNSGSIAATMGNLNITSQLNNNLLVNNLAGILSATNAINIRDAAFGSNFGTVIDGGSVLSKELNIFGGTGSVALTSDQISGLINSTSGSLLINTASENLNIGSVQTVGDLQLTNQLGSFTNHQSIVSDQGSITFDASDSAHLTIDNTNGVVKALNGSINIRNAAYSGVGNSTVNGGDFLSENFNIHSGQGTAEVAVNDLTGTVQSSGTALHLLASTDVLTIGSQCLTGDPTYYNTGNISITGNIDVGEKLAILATGDITSVAGVTSIRARTGGGIGQDIVMVAGAALTPSTGATTVPGGTMSGSPPAGGIAAGRTVLVTGAGTGGSINLSASSGLNITANSTSTGNGGSVTLIAFNSGTTGGRVLLATNSVISTGASGAGKTNGSITIGAGSTSGTGNTIQAGTLNADGGVGTIGGDIIVRNVIPTVSAGGVLFDSTGAITNGGTFNVPGYAFGTGGNQGSVVFGAGSSQFMSTRGNIDIQGRNEMTIDYGTNSINSNGGNINITSENNLTITATGGIKTSPTSGAGGTVNIIANYDNQNVGSVIALTTPINTNAVGTGAAGNISLQSGNSALTSTSNNQNVHIGNLSAVGAGGGSGGYILLNAQGGDVKVGSITNSLNGCTVIEAQRSPSGAGVATARSVFLNGNILTGGGALYIGASGTVQTAVSGLTINTSGGNIGIAAGSLVSFTGFPTPSASVNILGTSSNGGSIDFSTNAIGTFTSGGGNITMVAFPTAAGTTGGQILFPTASTITSGGGFVTLVAGQTNTTGASIVVGNINSGNGAVTLRTATPSTPTQIGCCDGVVTGSFTTGALQVANITVGTITAGLGALTISTNGSLTNCLEGTAGITNVVQAKGNLSVGNFTSTGATLFQTGNGGNITTCGTCLTTGGDMSFKTSGNGTITINHTVTHAGAGNLLLETAGTGANITLNAKVTQTGAGNLTAQTSGTNSSVAVNADVTSSGGGALTLTSGNAGTSSVALASGAIASGGTTTVNTPSLTMAANSALKSTAAAADVSVLSNVAITKALTVNMNAAGTLISSASGNVTFNTSANSGQITLTGSSTNGVISANSGAGRVTFFSGIGTPMSATLSRVDGIIGGTGNAFNVTVSNANTATGTLDVGNITSNGNISISSIMTGAGIRVWDNITSNTSSINMTSAGAAGKNITVNSGVTIKAGTTVVLNTSKVDMSAGSNSIIAQNGNVDFQQNTGGALEVVTGSGSAITATGGTNSIRFNPSTAGSVDVNGPGSLTAPGQILMKTGGANGSVTVGAISGTVSATGTVGAFTATTQTSSLTVANVTTTGASIATAGNGNLSVTSLAGGSTVALTASDNGNITIDSVSGTGAVTVTNNSTQSGKGAVTIQGTGLKSNNASVAVSSGTNGSITINAGAPVAASTTVSLQAGTNGSVTTNAKVSGGGDVSIASGTAGDVTLNAQTTSGAALSLTSGTGATNKITIAAGVVADGATTAKASTPSLILDGTLQSNSGILTVQGTGGGAANTLSVTMGTSGAITSLNNNVQFNSTGLKGAITMNNTKGAISAGGAIPTVTMHGGSAAVDVNVNTINCCTGGTGSTFSVQVNSGDLKVGNINASAATTLKALGTTGDVITCGTIDSSAGTTLLQSSNGNVVVNKDISASTLQLTSATGATNSVTIASTATAQGVTTKVSTPILVQDGTLKSTTGLLTVQGTGGGVGANTLKVTMGTTGAITSTGNNVEFNSSTAKGAITMNNGKGAISAGGLTPTVTMHGGTAAVDVVVDTINCCTGGTGSTFNLQVNTGDLKAGNISASGATTIQANGTGGNVLTCGTITTSSGQMLLKSTSGSVNVGHDVKSTGGNLQLTSGANSGNSVTIAASVTASGSTTASVNTPLLNQNGTLKADGLVTVQGTGGAGANTLKVDMGSGGAITSVNGNVQFNSSANKGSITMTSGLGSISAGGLAPTVTMHGGTAAVDVSVNTINCCTGGTGSTFSVQVNSGNLQAGGISTTGATTLTATGTGGNVLTCGTIESTTGQIALQSSSGNVQVDHTVNAKGGALLLSSGTGASNSVSIAAGISASGSTTATVNTPLLNQNGTLQSGSGILTVQGTGGGTNSLKVTMGTSGSITSLSSNVQFNSAAKQGSITMNNTNGAISAGGLNPTVTMHGGSAAVDVNVNTINCCTGGTGSTFAVQVNSGNLQAGGIVASGSTTLTANGATGDVLTCGTIESTSGTTTLQSKGGSVLVNHKVEQTGGDLVLKSSSTGAVTLASGVTASGKTAVAVTTPTLTLNSNAQLNATNGDLSVVSNAGGGTNPLNVVLNTGSQINANASGAKVTFNAGAPGLININANAGKGTISSATVVTLNGGSNAVNVDVDTIVGCVGGSGNPFNVTTASAATLNLGNITSPSTINFNAALGDIAFCADCSSTGGSIKATTLTTKSITVNSGVTVTGNKGIEFSTGTLNNNGSVIATTGTNLIKANTINNNASAIIQATAGNVDLQANGATTLSVVTATGSNINAQGGGSDIRFNPTTGAAVSVTGTGNLSAVDQIILKTGGADATVTVKSVSGTLTGNGNVGNLLASTTASGLTINGITTTGTAAATAGNGTLSVTSLSGGSTVDLNVTAGGNLIANTVSGAGAVTLTNSSTTAATGAVTIGGTGLSSSGSSVKVSSGTNGDITVSSGAPVSAKTTVDFIGGTNSNVISNAKISSANGNVSIASGSAASVTLNANVESGAALALTSGGGTNSITIASGVTASGTTTAIVNTPTLKADGTLQSGSGLLTVQGTGTGNALTVTMGAAGAIKSLNNNVEFNSSTNKGSITMNNGKGAIFAGSAVNPTVTMHGGSAAVDVDVNTINCCTGGTGSTFRVQVESGDLKVGNISASDSVTLKANGGTGDVLTCGKIESTSGTTTLQSSNGNVVVGHDVSQTGGALVLKSGTGAANFVTINSGITASGSTTVDVSTPNLNQSGTLQAGGLLTVQGTGTNNALNVVMGNAGAIKSTGGNVQFNSSTAKGAITMLGGKGAISAAGLTPTVTMHGGGFAVDVDVNTINCCVGGTGTTFGIQVESGDLKVGGITATGSTTLKANGATGDVLTCGTISSNSGTTTLQSANGNVVVGHDVSQTGGALVLQSGSGATNSVTINAGKTASGSTTTTVNTPLLTNNGTLQSGSGILTVQGTGTDNALSVSMGASGSIKSLTSNVQFNTATKQGSITMNNGNGAISASTGTGTVTMHGGNKVVNVNVNTIDCCTGGTGSDFTIIVNSGDLKVGGITTSGVTTLKANGTSGDVLTCGTISSTGTTTSLESKAGNVVINNKVSNTGDLNVTSGPAGSVTIGAETSSTTAALKVTSGTGASSKVTINAGITASGATTATVNTPAFVQDGTLQSGSGILTVQGTGTDNALSVTMGAAGVIKSTGSNVKFNSAGLQGSITMLGGKGDIIALGTSPTVTMHGGGKAVDVNVNSINCCTGGTGSTFSIQVASGDLKVGGITTTGTTTLKANGATGDVLTCGTINASGGDLTMQSANGNVQLSHAVSETTGKLILTSGTAGKVQIDSGITVEGKTSVNVTTPTLSLATNAKLNATAGDLVVVSNAGGGSNPLNVVLNSGSQLNANATGAKVTFNVGAPGSININANPGQGLISSATVVTLEGGSKAVNVNVDTIVGCVGGTGDPFNVTTGSTALLSVGNISTPGSLNFNTNGNLTFCGDCTSTAGSISATTPITKSITVNSTVTVKGETGINFATGTLNNSGSVIAVTGSAVFKANTINNNTGGVLQASAGNVELQANTVGTLTVVTQTGSNINAVGTNSKILFNPTTAAAVDVSGAGNLSAGKQLVLNTNGADATINAGSISGTLTANGNVGVLVASTLNSGLTIDGITTTGAATATAGNGNLLVSNLSGGSTVDLKVTAGGNLTANTVQGVGNVTLKNQSTGTGEGAVTIGGTGLKSTGGAVSLISGTKGDITVNSGAPVSAKTTLDFAAGTNGNVVTNAKVSSDGNLTIASGSAGSVTLNANAASNAAALKITSGTGAGNSVTISSGVTASGFTTSDVNTPLLNQDGTLQSGSGLLTVQGTAADNALKVVMGTDGVITSTGNSVQFNTAAKEGSITMNNGNGAISAFGTTPTVTLHGGSKAVDVNVNTINCCTGGTGSTFSVQVNSGDLKVGNISTSGVTTLKANGTTGDVLTCGTISSTGTDTTLQSKGGNVVVDHKVSNTGNMNLLSGPAGSVTINAEVSSTAAALTVTSGTGATSNVTIKAGATASGATTADVNTPTLNQNGTLKSGTGILTVQGTGTDNALTVVMGSTGAITSTGSNV